MTRPSLLPSRSIPPSSPPGAASPPSDFARWLTRDLRIKGASTSEPPVSSVPAPSLSPPTIEVAADDRPSDFALFLASDLRPRGSKAPDSLAPQLLPPQLEPGAPAEGMTRETGPLESLPPPTAGGLDAAAAEAGALDHAAGAGSASLHDDDLAVLPMRPSRFLAARRRQRGLGVAALCALLALGLWSFCGVRSASDAEVRAAAAEALPPAPAVLLPPPPDFVLTEEAEITEQVMTRARPRGARAEEPEVLDEAEIWRRGGPNVRRFADLPLPTLSKLAREENERIRTRDATVRKKLQTAP